MYKRQASNSLHEHENRNSDLYCNKTLVSTSQCSLRTKIPLCHNGTHASSQLRALTPPEHFSTPSRTGETVLASQSWLKPCSTLQATMHNHATRRKAIFGKTAPNALWLSAASERPAAAAGVHQSSAARLLHVLVS